MKTAEDKIIIYENEDCDAEYFLASWFGMNKLPKHRMILYVKQITEMMEAYHEQKSKFKAMEQYRTEGLREELVMFLIKKFGYTNISANKLFDEYLKQKEK